MIPFRHVALALWVSATGVAGVGCSSSSSGEAPAPGGEAGVDSSLLVESGAVDSGAGDGGAMASSGHSLVWKVVTTPPTDGGPGASVIDAGSDATADARTTDAQAPTGTSDAGASDASDLDGSSGDASTASPNVPVSGVQVCVYQTPAFACVTTDDGGLFTMSGLPDMTNLALTVEKDGYRSALRPIQTASGNMDGTGNPISIQLTSDPGLGPDAAVDWQTRGVVSFFAVAPLPGSGTQFGGDPGAKVSLSPVAGEGPYFVYDDGGFAPDAGALVATAGIYDNLPPGPYQITLEDPNHNCEPILSPFGEWGYPAPPLSVKFPIVAGFLTGPVGFFCTNKPPIVDAGQ